MPLARLPALFKTQCDSQSLPADLGGSCMVSSHLLPLTPSVASLHASADSALLPLPAFVLTLLPLPVAFSL